MNQLSWPLEYSDLMKINPMFGPLVNQPDKKVTKIAKLWQVPRLRVLVDAEKMMKPCLFCVKGTLRPKNLEQWFGVAHMFWCKMGCCCRCVIDQVKYIFTLSHSYELVHSNIGGRIWPRCIYSGQIWSVHSYIPVHSYRPVHSLIQVSSYK